MNKQWRILAVFVAIFLIAYFLPLGNPRVKAGIYEAFRMVQWYARYHTLACVVPALFIAGAITTFLSKEAVLRHLGPKANKVEAYSVASVSGTVLAVCSCSVLPMFAGIYRVGAGLGPASAFLYAGPAINVLALFLTARVLGFQIGVARAVGAILFGIVIGLLMAVIFRRSEQERTAATMQLPDPPPSKRRLWQTVLFFAAMIAFLVFSDWFNPHEKIVTMRDGTTIRAVWEMDWQFRLQQPYAGHPTGEVVTLLQEDVAGVEDVDTWVVRIHHVRWYLAAAMGGLVLLMTVRWFDREEIAEWMASTWYFAKLLIPLLFGGVFAVGFLKELISEDQIATMVGDNSLTSNLIASMIGCLFYFATLTEIPILEALMKNGMAPGPALALLLAGPAMSIPSILVIRSIIGNRKTLAFTALVIVMATVAGMGYGAMFPGEAAQAAGGEVATCDPEEVLPGMEANGSPEGSGLEGQPFSRRRHGDERLQTEH